MIAQYERNPDYARLGFSQKWKIRLHRKTEVSKTKAAAALAPVAGMTLRQAAWFVDRLPQLFAIPGSEQFHSVVFTEEEAKIVYAKLSACFEIAVTSAEEDVLGYGMTFAPPWETIQPPTG